MKKVLFSLLIFFLTMTLVIVSGCEESKDNKNVDTETIEQTANANNKHCIDNILSKKNIRLYLADYNNISNLKEITNDTELINNQLTIYQVSPKLKYKKQPFVLFYLLDLEKNIPEKVLIVSFNDLKINNIAQFNKKVVINEKDKQVITKHFNAQIINYEEFFNNLEVDQKLNKYSDDVLNKKYVSIQFASDDYFVIYSLYVHEETDYGYGYIDIKRDKKLNTGTFIYDRKSKNIIELVDFDIVSPYSFPLLIKTNKKEYLFVTIKTHKTIYQEAIYEMNKKPIEIFRYPKSGT
ncbi:hypothetical protein ACFL56_02700 [Candidatus Margulisiibacteriota bacterium]